MEPAALSPARGPASVPQSRRGSQSTAARLSWPVEERDFYQLPVSFNLVLPIYQTLLHILVTCMTNRWGCVKVSHTLPSASRG